MIPLSSGFMVNITVHHGLAAGVGECYGGQMPLYA